MSRFFVAVTLAALILAPVMAVSGEDAALAADDECADNSCALNALQLNGKKVEMDAQAMLNRSAPDLAFLEAGADRFKCGAIWCANDGSFCCSKSMGSICCHRGGRCSNMGEMPMCL
ncbi:unnamed protein product [Polarella glacialis]|uniref:Granulins domain-containing protein n=1 Tax=Polarella glacialis TaxID=89957 RepID=A0A813JG26_POLGL|nr:unnamed protein product [Polarella glacialis]